MDGPSIAVPSVVPTHTHEAIVQLLSDSPGLVHDLLRRSLGVDLPPYADVHRLDANLSEAAPTEYRSDGTMVFADASGANVAAVVVEVQLRPDPDKAWRWPAYLAQARDRLRCETDLFVLTLDEATAQWAKRRVRLGRANTFDALVLGPSQIPRVETTAAARASPELAVLSSIAHAALTDATTAMAIAAGLTGSRLEEERVAYYIDLIRDLLPQVVQKALEAMVIPADYVPHSYISKRIMSSLAKGRAEGGAAALGRAIEALLSSRGLHLSPEQMEIVGNCTDLDQLQRWVVRAAHVETTDELFAKG